MNKEPITLHLETFNNEEYILADECIEAIGLHRRTNTELHQTIEEKDKEIERLKQGYCELKEKCNNGECDCTHEEYNGMCEQNIKMDLEIERLKDDNKYLNKLNIELSSEKNQLNSIIKEVRECVEKELGNINTNENIIAQGICLKIKEILDKSNNKTKEVMPVEELESYEPKNMAEQEYQDWFWEGDE